MAQQFHNGGHHDHSVTVSIRDSRRYAVINQVDAGKHTKTTEQRQRRHRLYIMANRAELYGDAFASIASKYYSERR